MLSTVVDDKHAVKQSESYRFHFQLRYFFIDLKIKCTVFQGHNIKFENSGKKPQHKRRPVNEVSRICFQAYEKICH
jgi:hypothetical protein